MPALTASATPTRPRSTVLVVDDVPDNLLVVSDLLREAGYRVRAANSGPVALRYAAQAPRPDLILLDIMMPGMDGYEVLRRLRADAATHEIPVIFLTARADEADEEHGLAIGAADYLTKPIRPLVALARVRSQIDAARARRLLDQERHRLLDELSTRTVESEISRKVSIRALAHLAGLRDAETGSHILRTQGYVRELALGLQRRPRDRAVLSDGQVALITETAPLHDIGKVGIPDHILRKPGPLTADEWRVMREHTTIGARAIEMAAQETQQAIEFLQVARQIALSHHERWDGQGYPQGLAGEAIPLPARIMAVADVFDALVTPRVYKAAMSFDEAYRLITADSGSRYDPDVVAVFHERFERLVGIARAHAEPEDAGA